MSDNMRKALYALVPILVAVFTTYGILTQQLGVLWANVLAMLIGFAYAASKATGNRLLDPQVRRALYVLLPSVVALLGGYFSLDVGLWTSVVLSIMGAVVAIWNVDPAEVVQGEVVPNQDPLL